MDLEKAVESYMNGMVKGIGLILGLILLSSPLYGGDEPEKRTTFFVGRLKYSQNDGDDCSSVAREFGKLLSRASTIEVQDEKKIRLADDNLYETPFLFMNGHNDFVLSEKEVANLRKYFTHGGFLLGSGCCNYKEFPEAWRREFSRIFPGSAVRKIPYDHLIYRAFYKIDQVKSLDTGEEIRLDGLFYNDELVAVMCEDGLCCSFAMGNECNSGHGVAAEDGKKLALNIAVYALTH